MRKLAYWMTLLLIFTIPWENVITLPQLGTMGRITGVIGALIWGLQVIVNGRLRRITIFHIAGMAFMLWNIASYFWSIATSPTLVRAQTYVQLLFFVWILWDVLVKPEHLRAAIQAYIIGAYVSIFNLVNSYLQGTHQNVQGRFTTTGFNENAIAFILALGIPIAWHLFCESRATFEDAAKNPSLIQSVFRLINLMYVPAALYGIMLTASRGGIIASVPAIIFILLSLKRLSLLQRTMIISSVALGIVFLISLVPQSSINRLSTIGQSISGGDLGERGGLWIEGLEVVKDNPLIGVGSNTVAVAVPSEIVVHNTFLSIAAESGIIGLSLFLTVIFICFFHAVKQPRWQAMVWVSVLLVWLLDANTFAWEYRKATWLFFSFIIINAYTFEPYRERLQIHAKIPRFD